MPEDAEAFLGTRPDAPLGDKTEATGGAGAAPPPAGSPVPTPANAHQLTSFPVVAVILLHYLTCGIFSFIWLNLMHGKLPRIRSDDPSAGRAVGFCFIPFFNLYWIFFTYRRLCLRVDEQRELYGLPPSNLRGMATTSCIFQVIPYINGLIGYTIITPIFIGLMQSSVNQLADKSATTAPRATLPTQTTAPGMPGWAIALVVCGCLVPVMAIMAALLLPALVAAKNKAQVINSESNLKQIGLAFKIWADDNNDQFPFNVGQAQGGVKELCETDGNGFEKNPAAVFMVMSNELSTTRILVCPNDNTKQPAADFASLTANNISYQLRSGTNVNEGNPEEVLAVDPINGLVLHCDGSVELDLSYKKQDVNN
jgi:uncharacterized protein DUF4234